MKRYILVGLLVAVLLVGCQPPSVPPSNGKSYSCTNKGVGFVSGQSVGVKSDIVTDFKLAESVGDIIINAAPQNGIPNIIEAGFKYAKCPIPNMGGETSDYNALKNYYVELARKYKPPYIGVGNEIERMPNKAEFVSHYNEIYDAIKSASPNTKVYPVFQYESFEPALVDQMKMDLLVFTSYPFMKYADVSKIPDTYYDLAKQKATEKGVKIAFTEIGWIGSDPRFTGTQVEFYQRFNVITQHLPLEFVSWGLLYGAPQAGKEWADMGLFDSTGQKKPIYNAFVNG